MKYVSLEERLDEKSLTTQEEIIPQPILAEARSGSYAGDALSQ